MRYPPKGDLQLLGHVGGETGASYYRHEDGSIWRQCWGDWRGMTPEDAIAGLLNWPDGYLAEVEAAPADADWANIERRRIAGRRQLAQQITDITARDDSRPGREG